jgi:hypothetical protein
MPTLRERLGSLGAPASILIFKGAVESAMVVAILAMAVRTVQLLAAPLPQLSPPPVEADWGDDAFYAAAAAAGGNPFRRSGEVAPTLSAPLQESALNITLYGTWSGAAGGAAMLSADGAEQRKVAIGEEIVAGVRLAEVRDEYVVIDNQGAREAVPIANRKVDLAAALQPVDDRPTDAATETLAQPPVTATALRDAAPEQIPAGAPMPAAALRVIEETPSDSGDAAVPDDED